MILCSGAGCALSDLWPTDALLLIMQNFQTIHCVVLQAANQAEAFNLVHPHDRHGKPIADRHCTREVEEALNDYRAACDTARAAVRGQLRLLAETLQVLSTPIPCAYKSS